MNYIHFKYDIILSVLKKRERKYILDRSKEGFVCYLVENNEKDNCLLTSLTVIGSPIY